MSDDMISENPLGFRDRLVSGLALATNRLGDKLRLSETPAERQGRMVAALYFWQKAFGVIDAGTKTAIVGGTLGLIGACGGTTTPVAVEIPTGSPQAQGGTNEAYGFATPTKPVEKTATVEPTAVKESADTRQGGPFPEEVVSHSLFQTRLAEGKRLARAVGNTQAVVEMVAAQVDGVKDKLVVGFYLADRGSIDLSKRDGVGSAFYWLSGSGAEQRLRQITIPASREVASQLPNTDEKGLYTAFNPTDLDLGMAMVVGEANKPVELRMIMVEHGRSGGDSVLGYFDTNTGKFIRTNTFALEPPVEYAGKNMDGVRVITDSQFASAEKVLRRELTLGQTLVVPASLPSAVGTLEVPLSTVTATREATKVAVPTVTREATKTVTPTTTSVPRVEVEESEYRNIRLAPDGSRRLIWDGGEVKITGDDLVWGITPNEPPIIDGFFTTKAGKEVPPTERTFFKAVILGISEEVPGVFDRTVTIKLAVIGRDGNVFLVNAQTPGFFKGFEVTPKSGLNGSLGGWVAINPTVAEPISGMKVLGSHDVGSRMLPGKVCLVQIDRIPPERLKKDIDSRAGAISPDLVRVLESGGSENTAQVLKVIKERVGFGGGKGSGPALNLAVNGLTFD